MFEFDRSIFEQNWIGGKHEIGHEFKNKYSIEFGKLFRLSRLLLEAIKKCSEFGIYGNDEILLLDMLRRFKLGGNVGIIGIESDATLILRIELGKESICVMRVWSILKSTTESFKIGNDRNGFNPMSKCFNVKGSVGKVSKRLFLKSI